MTNPDTPDGGDKAPIIALAIVAAGMVFLLLGIIFRY